MSIQYNDIPFEKSIISQEKLDIEKNRRMNSLPWRGQFSPGVVEALLDEYAPKNGIILDPFCGSGTTLLEASTKGNKSYGVELNPAAYILARLYTFSGQDLTPIEATLNNLNLTLSQNLSITENAKNLAAWIKERPTKTEKIIMEAVFLLILGNGENIKDEKIHKSFDQVRQVLQKLSKAKAESHLILGDARRTGLEENTIDLVLTSPPYINVFNYHQNYRRAVELLDWNVLPIAKSEFGSNRKNRSNRLRTVIQYAQDIGLALAESHRILKNNSKSVWIVGRESKVRGCSIPNAEVIYRMATEGLELTLETKMERSFTSRYGQVVYEDILVFSHKKPTLPKHDLNKLGREVGINILETLKTEDEKVKAEIQDAIDFSQKISASPFPKHDAYS